MRRVRGRRKTEKRKSLVGRGGRSHAGSEDGRTSKEREWCHSSRCLLFSLHSFFYWTLKTSLGDPLSWLGKPVLQNNRVNHQKEASKSWDGYGVHGACARGMTVVREIAWKDLARAAACFARHSTFQTEILLLRACHRQSWLKVLVSEKERE